VAVDLLRGEGRLGEEPLESLCDDDMLVKKVDALMARCSIEWKLNLVYL